MSNQSVGGVAPSGFRLMLLRSARALRTPMPYLAFIGIGWLKSYVAQTSRIRSIAETLFLGAAAAVLSYIVGSWLETLLN